MSKHCPQRFKSSLGHTAWGRREKKKKRKPPNHQCWDHLEWSNPCFKSLCSPVPLQCWRVWAECRLLGGWRGCWLLRSFFSGLFGEAAFFPAPSLLPVWMKAAVSQGIFLWEKIPENPQGKPVPLLLGEKAVLFQDFQSSIWGDG